MYKSSTPASRVRYLSSSAFSFAAASRSISGGILGCFPITPIKPCSFYGPIPGMAAECFGDDGKPVRGQVGELVVTRPWPGMTQGFWRDPKRYEETYWSRWDNVWVHGDWAYVDDDGYWFLQGRSDDTLKIAGKRLGPAEVESVLVELVPRREPPVDTDPAVLFRVVEEGFAQRRKTMRNALVRLGLDGSRAEEILASAGVDARARAEALGLAELAAIADAIGGAADG